ncbi:MULTISPECIES: hypothetical protein [unclassified Ruegeria]|uniref:hypothetical protein n=1 Tax=unclassified Ruegeria TaxID=2625375 RepID=UPI001487C555|nr:MULTISPECIES: hypothetical protein [unclassified Ruegeria]NOD63039.1 hypothetical protein [Ruegeria sp. HKCCD6109]NOD91785.1 hypothetical protein [Ruegeria sp. HKCCD4884]
MARSTDPNDHKGLILEAYRIEGISLPECRSIFLDWALSLPADRDQNTALAELHAGYVDQNPDHPMTQVLSEGLQAAQTPKRRGGWRSRNR